MSRVVKRDVELRPHGLDTGPSLFDRISLQQPPTALSIHHGVAPGYDHVLDPGVDERMLELFARADDPSDAIELRDLYLGRLECETGRPLRPWQVERWRASRVRRTVHAEDVLNARSTVRFVKETFNTYFRDDLYGALRSERHLILSSGSVDEAEWGLPEALKACVRYALDRDWYGYSDSLGRAAAREAIAAYESARIRGDGYTLDNVAVTMGATSAVSGLVDMLLTGNAAREPALCAIPNYPALVASIERRGPTRLVPLACRAGEVSLTPLIEALTPATPLVLLQTVSNPTGALVREADLARLIRAASPSTMILLDECHEWLGPMAPAAPERRATNVIRVSSISKTWSAPGLKIGWVLADPSLISDYYEYASTSFGGPPSFFYTLIEVLARMERWVGAGLDEAGPVELAEFEPGYRLGFDALSAAYRNYRSERLARDDSLRKLREATVDGLADVGALVIAPRYSINMAVSFQGYLDSYSCFRDLLADTGVSLFPGLLTFCLSGSACRVTSARPQWQIAEALSRLKMRTTGPRA